MEVQILANYSKCKSPESEPRSKSVASMGTSHLSGSYQKTPSKIWSKTLPNNLDGQLMWSICSMVEKSFPDLTKTPRRQDSSTLESRRWITSLSSRGPLVALLVTPEKISRTIPWEILHFKKSKKDQRIIFHKTVNQDGKICDTKSTINSLVRWSKK